MELKTFRGGIHPPYQKEATADKAIEDIALPGEVVILLRQHIGAPAVPTVNVGDRVETGQVIGSSDAFVSAPVHASVSGTVTAIEERRGPTGDPVNSVVVAVDPNQPAKWTESRVTGDIPVERLRESAREAGLVGLGGAAFPTAVKLSPPEGKPIDVVIINGCECEPFLTCDHRLMVERPDALLEGLRLMMRAVGAGRGVIGIESNKPDAIETIRERIGTAGDIDVVALEVKYPQGNEKMLIDALTGRKVPPGALPSEVGALVQNVGTAVAFHEAVSTGKPVIERVITVTGPGIKRPANVMVKLGTPIGHIIDQCGGIAGTPAKVIMGGPMTGWTQKDLSAPVVKGTSGIVILNTVSLEKLSERDCVGCDRCVEACPMYLMPNMIARHTRRGQYEMADKYGARDCFECGCCSYVCPSRIPHVAYVRIAKAELSAAAKK